MTKKETRILCILLVLFTVFISSPGTALAAEDSGGLNFSIDTFAGDMNFSELDSLKPLAELILIVILFIYGITIIAGLVASGIKGNISTILKSNDLRNEGLKGNIHIVGGLFMLCLALLGVAIIWNNYGPGTW